MKSKSKKAVKDKIKSIYEDCSRLSIIKTGNVPDEK